MSQPPTGTVTFLFTDIEGSTARWDHHPDAMRAALVHHDTLLRDAVERHGGHVFKTVGDAFCAAFAAAGSGLAAAIAAQRALAAEDWAAFGKDFPPLAVRMGLHTGEATERGGDYFGPPVNRVARIEAAGHGGQILLSSATRSQIEADGLPVGIRLRDRGEHRLKDLRHTEHIVQVVVDGLPDVAKALRTVGEISAQDRIVVTDPHDEWEGADDDRATVVSRTVDETLTALEAVVRGDSKSVVLTAEQVVAAARHRSVDWREWRLCRIAEWSQPRYRLDGRFVGLTLLIDQGEESVQGRWAENEERYGDLGALLAAVGDPAIVVLGSPGSGKSTLLRRLELDMAIAGLRGEAEGERVTFFVALNTFAPARPGDPPPAPGEWLAAQWSARNPALPPLDALVTAGRVTFLIDALNEVSALSERDSRRWVELWKTWLQHLSAAFPGNRVIFSCRSLDYSQPLSTPDLRVPQVRIEPLSDDRVRDFLRFYSPGRWREIWAVLENSPQLEVLRSPYFLALLVEQVEGTGEMPEGRATLFTGFVRQALRREVERGNALFEPGELLESRDLGRIAKWQWQGAYGLPDRGPLIPKLSMLAHAMQQVRFDGGSSQVRIEVDAALDLLDSKVDTAILAAGEALAVLDEDEAAGELMYIHQLVQEYFAARQLAITPDSELVRVEWQAAKIGPTAAEVLDSLAPADPLPPLSGTGWEETTVLAAAMAADPVAFLRDVMATNLALAGRAAAQPELRPRLPDEVLDALRWSLVARSRDADADLRDRIACGDTLGELGDPRFERRVGPHGAYLRPPLVEIPGGTYLIGDDEPIRVAVWDQDIDSLAHMPRHPVQVALFQIGQFPVTNAEWRLFMVSGGYDEERWWDTEHARLWRRGELVDDVGLDNSRHWRKVLVADPELFEQMVEEGGFESSEVVERWRIWKDLDEPAFQQAMDARWRPKRDVEPRYWRDARLNRPAQPIVGISWYEARAYCAWLSAQTGLALRLPTEAEWEAAARGPVGSNYPWGEGPDPMKANSFETRVKRTTPIGVFPGGDSEVGAVDMSGNVFEWTSSLASRNYIDEEASKFAYPYDRADGREDAEAAPSMPRVARGGGWSLSGGFTRAAYRAWFSTVGGSSCCGFRVALNQPGIESSSSRIRCI